MKAILRTLCGCEKEVELPDDWNLGREWLVPIIRHQVDLSPEPQYSVAEKRRFIYRRRNEDGIPVLIET